MLSRDEISFNEDVVKLFEYSLSCWYPDDHWMFDKIKHVESGDWEYRSESVEDDFLLFINFLCIQEHQLHKSKWNIQVWSKK